MTASSRLLARLIPLLAPLAACGGSTTSPTGTTGTPGAGGNGAQGTGGGNATGGSAAQGGTSSLGGGGSSVGGATAICTVSTPLVPGVDTGYFLCVGSAIHRTTILACPDKLPLTGGACGNPAPGNCVDSGCTASPHGYCAANSGGGALICTCHYGCVTDAECGGGKICLCDGSIGTCVTAACSKDADCQGGAVCLSFGVPGGCSATTQFACTTPQDLCLSDADCKSDGGFPPICGHDGSKRVCLQGPGACAGRPLFVDDAARLAALRRSRASENRGWSTLG